MRNGGNSEVSATQDDVHSTFLCSRSDPFLRSKVNKHGSHSLRRMSSFKGFLAQLRVIPSITP